MQTTVSMKIRINNHCTQPYKPELFQQSNLKSTTSFQNSRSGTKLFFSGGSGCGNDISPCCNEVIFSNTLVWYHSELVWIEMTGWTRKLSYKLFFPSLLRITNSTQFIFKQKREYKEIKKSPVDDPGEWTGGQILVPLSKPLCNQMHSLNGKLFPLIKYSNWN